MNAHLSSLLDREVSRKDFLSLSGLAVASVLGFGAIVKLLTGKSLSGHPSLGAQLGMQPLSRRYGYGASAYGGSKE